MSELAPRIALLLGPGPSGAAFFHALDRKPGLGLTIMEAPVGRVSQIRRKVRHWGWANAAGQVCFRAMVAPALAYGARHRIREIQALHRLDLRPIPDHRIVRVPTMNGPEAITALRAYRPNLVVVCGTRILSQSLLRGVPVPFINVHAGMTPSYRGVHGGYWAFASGEPEACGVTLHLLDAGVDTGRILAQAVIRPTDADGFATYPWLQVAQGLAMLPEVIQEALSGHCSAQASGSRPSQLWTHPTAFQYLKNRVLLGLR